VNATGEQIYTEMFSSGLTEYPDGAEVLVPANDDLLTDLAMDDAALAAKFTGRIE
jgi:hypothetical protein